MSLIHTRALVAASTITLIALTTPVLAKPVRHSSYEQQTVATSVHRSKVHKLERRSTRLRKRHRIAALPPHRAAFADNQVTSEVDSRFQPSLSPQVNPGITANADSAALPSSPIAPFGSTGVVNEARRYLGTNPTSRRSLWCGTFMNLVLERSGYRGTGSDLARSFASYGRRISGPQVGAIAVMARKGGGHVGIVSGIDPSGNPIIISGNHNRRVAEAVYPRGRIYAYVMPN